MAIGLKDLPIEKKDGDLLSISKYVESLKEFITKCDTPMTVAIQGDWGTGKTSLMQMIHSDLQQENPEVETVWFNTWQYSQFSMDEYLSVSLISNLINKLNPEQLKSKVMESLKKITRIGIRAGVQYVSHGVVKLENEPEQKETDFSREIENLKDTLNQIVKDKLQKGNKKRIVIFVDDLDRLLPERAVSLLEIMKNFLDNEGCVYVLALDYAVVQKGLSAKFNVSAEDLGGRSFFDKIIQMPFSMPISQYDVDNYLRKILESLGLTYSEKDLPIYRGMLESSIGMNPRSLKRVVNILNLLSIVYNKTKEKGLSAIPDDVYNRILFGIICMQIAYEPLYSYLQRHPNKEGLHSLQEITERTEDPELANACERIPDFKNREILFSAFADAFRKSLEIDGDDQISKREERYLQTVLKVSSITAVEDSNPPESRHKAIYANDEISKFCRRVHSRIRSELAKQGFEHNVDSTDKDYAYYNNEGKKGNWREFVFYHLDDRFTDQDQDSYFYFCMDIFPENKKRSYRPGIRYLNLYGCWERAGVKKLLGRTDIEEKMNMLKEAADSFLKKNDLTQYKVKDSEDLEVYTDNFEYKDLNSEFESAIVNAFVDFIPKFDKFINDYADRGIKQGS